MSDERRHREPTDPGEQYFFMFYLGLPALIAILILLGKYLKMF